MQLQLTLNEVQAALLLIVYHTAPSNSFSHSISYIKSLYSEWPTGCPEKGIIKKFDSDLFTALIHSF